MSFTTITGRAFNQAVSEAKKAANLGPVFITDRGRPAHVLMSMATYQRLTGQQSKIADLLFMPGAPGMKSKSAIFDCWPVRRWYVAMLISTWAGRPRSVMKTGPRLAAFLASLTA